MVQLGFPLQVVAAVVVAVVLRILQLVHRVFCLLPMVDLELPRVPVLGA